MCKVAFQFFEARFSPGPSAAAQEDASVSQARFTNSQVRQNAGGEAEKYEKGTQNQRTHAGGKREGQELMRIGCLREDSIQRDGRSMTLCLLLKRNHQKISGFELRQLLSSIVIKRIRCLLFLIFF